MTLKTNGDFTLMTLTTSGEDTLTTPVMTHDYLVTTPFEVIDDSCHDIDNLEQITVKYLERIMVGGLLSLLATAHDSQTTLPL